jgi:hypothetical protein
VWPAAAPFRSAPLRVLRAMPYPGVAWFPIRFFCCLVSGHWLVALLLELSGACKAETSLRDAAERSWESQWPHAWASTAARALTAPAMSWMWTTLQPPSSRATYTPCATTTSTLTGAHSSAPWTIKGVYKQLSFFLKHRYVPGNAGNYFRDVPFRCFGFLLAAATVLFALLCFLCLSVLQYTDLVMQCADCCRLADCSIEEEHLSVRYTKIFLQRIDCMIHVGMQGDGG